MNTLIKLDTRGRLVIPTEYREALDMAEGDLVLMSLDENRKTLTINPIYGEQTQLIQLEIVFKDEPGSLARIAAFLSDQKIDLIMTESKSSQRGKIARWSIIADIQQRKRGSDELQQELMDLVFVEQVSIKKIPRGRLHH